MAAALPPLIVRLVRTSPTHHRLELSLGDRVESRELETRSCLLHDLVHFALESEAGLCNGFYGHLARGVRYDALAHDRQRDGALRDLDELLLVERVVGPLQSAWKSGRLDPAAFVATFAGYQRALGEACPAWLDEDLVARASARLRQLDGQWRSTRFGAPMELRFPVR
jgi:hypothetical protein